MGATLIDRQSGPLTEADIAPAGDTRYQRIAQPDPGVLWGCVMSTAGASTTLTVSAGYAVDSTNVLRMRLASAIAKTTSAWALGTAAGGLDTGTIANSTWYHWFVVYNPTTLAVDVVFSATATPAAGPTTMPSGYTLFRRIGSGLTNGSGQWTAFLQTGDEFIWSVPVQNYNFVTNLGTTGANYTVSTPLNLITKVIAHGLAQAVSGTQFAKFYNPALPDTAAGYANMDFLYNTGGGVGCGGDIINALTNTSSQIRGICSQASNILNLVTSGWIDTRGRNA